MLSMSKVRLLKRLLEKGGALAAFKRLCAFFRSAEVFRNSMNGVIRCRTYLSMCPFAKKLWADQIFVTCKKVHTYFISTLFEWPTLESFGISSFSRVSTSLNNCILFFSPCGCSMK